MGGDDVGAAGGELVGQDDDPARARVDALTQQRGLLEQVLRRPPAVHAHRTIVVQDRTRHENVTNGESVQFDVNGQRFTFAFNNWPNKDIVDLSVIAPDGVTTPNVRVYIAPDPMSRG